MQELLGTRASGRGGLPFLIELATNAPTGRQIEDHSKIIQGSSLAAYKTSVVAASALATSQCVHVQVMSISVMEPT